MIQSLALTSRFIPRRNNALVPAAKLEETEQA
jgi:hypothetical protein